MASPRKRYSAEIKAKVALEAIKGQKTTNEIASEYGVHPSQIAQWKKQVLDELPEVFSSQRGEHKKARRRLSAPSIKKSVSSKYSWTGSKKIRSALLSKNAAWLIQYLLR